MSYSTCNLLNLSDELLLMILKKLCNMDVLYSMIGVNKRLDKFVQDIIFTEHLDFTKISSNEDDLSKNSLILYRFCRTILPRIRHNIQSFTLDPFSIPRIFNIRGYSQLKKLILTNLKIEMAVTLFRDSSRILTLKNQITDLVVMINGADEHQCRWCVSTNIFADICQAFSNLIHFHFDLQNKTAYRIGALYTLPSQCYSSSIVYLNIKVQTFNDCLWLLDGHLNQLHTLIIEVIHISDTSATINNTNILSNLKCFSLICCNVTMEYDEQIFPIVRQMLKLEKLILSLDVYGRNSFIDGNHLINYIINKMLYLQIFIFDILTDNVTIDPGYLPRLDNLRDLLNEKGQNLDGYVDHHPNETSLCHIYTLPFYFEFMHPISTRFVPTGVFKNVRRLSLIDRMRSIKYDFFVLISQTFPFVKDLTVLSPISQNKQLNQSEQTHSILEYSHLSNLNLVTCHIDYVKQFLRNRITHLPCLNTLHIDFFNLMNLTKNFTIPIMNINCANLIELICYKIPLYYQQNQTNFHQYFPNILYGDAS